MNECRYSGWCYHNVEMMAWCDGKGTETDISDRPIGKCEHYQPMPDVEVLRSLADVLGGASTELCSGCMLEGCAGAKCALGIAHEAASRIREALGEENR